MINIEKDFFVKLCKNSGKPVHKTNKSITLRELRYIYTKLLGAENTCIEIEDSKNYDKPKFLILKNRINSMKLLIRKLETRISS
jgi:hypothetical protein